VELQLLLQSVGFLGTKVWHAPLNKKEPIKKVMNSKKYIALAGAGIRG